MGSSGFTIGGEEVLPYGALINSLLLKPDFMSALPELLPVFFIGHSLVEVPTTL